MNVALVLAGGQGQRMNQSIPKQFINIYDKPVIIYTLEIFQRHPGIDGIVVSCLEGWQEILRAYCKQFGITKLRGVSFGGENGQESILNGLKEVAAHYGPDDLVLVHDGIRPMVTEEIISDSIRVCTAHGSAVTAIPCTEVMLLTGDGLSSTSQVPRDELRRTQTPQTFPIGDLLSAHAEAARKGITDSVASCSLYVELGRRLYFSTGSEKNIKLTTVNDIDIFKALLKTEDYR